MGCGALPKAQPADSDADAALPQPQEPPSLQRPSGYRRPASSSSLPPPLAARPAPPAGAPLKGPKGNAPRLRLLEAATGGALRDTALEAAPEAVPEAAPAASLESAEDGVGSSLDWTLLSSASKISIGKLSATNAELQQMEARVEQLAAAMQACICAKELGTLKTHLAQLESRAKQLETTGVDDVYTGDLHSGQLLAKQAKKDMLRRFDALFVRVEYVFRSGGLGIQQERTAKEALQHDAAEKQNGTPSTESMAEECAELLDHSAQDVADEAFPSFKDEMLSHPLFSGGAGVEVGAEPCDVFDPVAPPVRDRPSESFDEACAFREEPIDDDHLVLQQPSAESTGGLLPSQDGKDPLDL